MTSPIRIILCGKTAAVGDVVTQHLKPRYEVIKFITSTSQGVSLIPSVLREQQAAAVVAGGGYDDAAVDEMRAAVPVDNRTVPWIRPDKSKTTGSPSGSEYAKEAAERVQEKLDELVGKGRAAPDGVYWY